MKRGGEEGSSDYTKKARSAYSSPPPAGLSSGSQFTQLGAACQAEFHALFQSNKVKAVDIDESIYKSLLDFSDQAGADIVKSFSRADLSSVRNKTGFFIGILKAHRKKGEGLRFAPSSSSSSSSSPASFPPPSATYPPPPGSAYPPYLPPAYPPFPYPPYDPYSLPPDPSLPPPPGGPFGNPSYPYAPPPGFPPPFTPPPYAGGYPPYPYPPYAGFPPPSDSPYGPPDPAAFPNPYAPPPRFAPLSSSSDLANPSTYPERSKERNHVSRKSGGGLSALSRPIQDLFDQIFAMGHVLKDDVPDSIYDSLQDFEEDVQWAIVERFSKADLARVRNKTGYLIGILKIARQGKAAGQGFGSSKLGPTPATNPNSPFDVNGRGTSTSQNPPMEQSVAFTKLAPYVQQKFRELVRKREITDGDLDPGVFASLAAFDEPSQIDVIEIFASKDLSNIQNKTGFFIGIIKKQRVLKQNHDLVQGWN